ncbi:6-O-methylguanine DNA methyltransferase [Aspergillus cavernicola]|uniref:Methylated-DNA--protein-cysteine methyltransferase n=1 Tax=Aspergillus cavernicola TaxID=176166 RepID=A0ABR4HV23_9EURO
MAAAQARRQKQSVSVTVKENHDPLSGPHELLSHHYSPQSHINLDTIHIHNHNNKLEPDDDATPTTSPSSSPTETQPSETNPQNLTVTLLRKITTHPTLSPTRRKTYICLLSIPPGKWTTYGALAKHLNSSARAVGTAMRLNPFAPGVPCHRVLGRGGALGGYLGTAPDDKAGKGKGKGKGNLERKRRMLEEEGVRFDERERAVGEVFLEFPTTF